MSIIGTFLDLSLASVTCMLMLMDPYQSPQQPQASGQFNPSQYDFITNPAKPPKKSIIPGSGSSKTQRIVLVVAGLVILFMLIFIFASFITSSGRSNTEQLTAVLQTQTEVSRVAEIGENKSSTENAKKLASTVNIVVESQKNQLNSLLAKQEIKINPKQLSAGRKTETDQTLTTAEKNGRFDDAFVQTMRAELEGYQKTLKAAYDGSPSKSIREALNADYQQVTLLLEDITKQ